MEFKHYTSLLQGSSLLKNPALCCFNVLSVCGQYLTEWIHNLNKQRHLSYSRLRWFPNLYDTELKNNFLCNFFTWLFLFGTTGRKKKHANKFRTTLLHKPVTGLTEICTFFMQMNAIFKTRSNYLLQFLFFKW